MANIHVLDRQGAGFRCAVHIAVPAGNNNAGTAWSAALVRSGNGGTTTLPDGDGTGGTVSAAEKTSIAGGTVLEVVDVLVPPDNATTAAAINAWLDAYHAAKVSEVQARLQRELSQYGRVR